MAIATRMDFLSRDISVAFPEELSPEARSKTLAKVARETLQEAQQINLKATGSIPAHQTFVDGKAGVSESTVKPDGVIVYDFDLLDEMFEYIGDLLVQHAPVRTGRFQESFMFFADGNEVEAGAPLPADVREYVFLNSQPYSRKIERGLSPQAPDGVFEAVAALAARRYGNLAKIKFSYRTPTNIQISRIGPLRVIRKKNGRWAKGSHTRAGNQAERAQRQPAIVITR